MNEPPITELVDAIEQARAADFVRYVNRRMREDVAVRVLPFHLAWNMVVGEYARIAATDAEALA